MKSLVSSTAVRTTPRCSAPSVRDVRMPSDWTRNTEFAPATSITCPASNAAFVRPDWRLEWSLEPGRRDTCTVRLTSTCSRRDPSMIVKRMRSQDATHPSAQRQDHPRRIRNPTFPSLLRSLTKIMMKKMKMTRTKRKARMERDAVPGPPSRQNSWRCWGISSTKTQSQPEPWGNSWPRTLACPWGLSRSGSRTREARKRGCISWGWCQDPEWCSEPQECILACSLLLQTLSPSTILLSKVPSKETSLAILHNRRSILHLLTCKESSKSSPSKTSKTAILHLPSATAPHPTINAEPHTIVQTSFICDITLF